MIRIGKFGKTHGVNGEINLALEMEVDFEQCDFILAKVDGLMVPFEIETLRPRGDAAALVSFCRMTQELLQSMVNKEAYVDEQYIMEEEDEHSAAYYVGYTLMDEDGRRMGVIDDYDDQTVNVLFSVEGRLVPVGAMEVLEVDGSSKIIRCRLPEGILEIN